MSFYDDLEQEQSKKLHIKTQDGAHHELYSKTIIFGLPGSGKTTLCVELIRQCLEQGVRCLFVDSENKLKSNLYFQHLFEKKREELKKYVAVITNINESNRQTLLEEIKKHKVDIVIIDSFTNLFLSYLADNKRGEMRTFMNKVIDAANGKQLITVHHAYNARKFKATENIHIYGGDAISYFADEIVKLRFDRHDQRLIRLVKKAVEAVLPYPLYEQPKQLESIKA